MKSSTIIFNAAAVLALLAILVGLVQLVKNRQTAYGVETAAPATALPDPMPVALPPPEPETAPPVMGVSDPSFNWDVNRHTLQPMMPTQFGNQFSGTSAFNPYSGQGQVPGVPGQPPMMPGQAPLFGGQAPMMPGQMPMPSGQGSMMVGNGPQGPTLQGGATQPVYM